MTKPPATVDEYLASVGPEFRPLLRSVRKTIRAAAPKATESISYGIPTYKQDGQRVIYFSAAAKHCAIHMVRTPALDEARGLGFGVGHIDQIAHRLWRICRGHDRPVQRGIVACNLRD